MDKRDVAVTLERIASYLELQGENEFRVRTFQNAARTVAGLSMPIAEALATGELERQRGIGKTTLTVVRDLLETGHSRLLERLKSETPPGLVEMLRISGLGVAKVRQIHEQLGISGLDELEAAARDGRLASLPRFGAKTAQNVIRGVGYLRRSLENKLFHHAQKEAVALAAAFDAMPGVTDTSVTGALRRHCELISELDFVLRLDAPKEQVRQRILSVEGLTEYDTGPDTLQLKFASGGFVNVTLSTPDQYGFHVARTTGSAAHNDLLARLALERGLEFTEAGLTRDKALLPCPSEGRFFGILQIQQIPAELREGRNEVGLAARSAIPELVSLEDLEGFLHCHSNYSDGTSTVADWARDCPKAGYSYVGITDHSASATYAGGLDSSSIAKQHAEIDAANEGLTNFRVLKGVEADILGDGDLDYTPEERSRFDFIIASVHNQLTMSRDAMTDRILSAMDDPHMAILGHPTGRLLLSRDPYDLDLPAVFQKAAETGVAVEINSDPQRLDLDWRHVDDAIQAGATISIGADAHSTQGMHYMEMGVGIARKGMLTKEQVLNCRSCDEFLDFSHSRRKR